MTASHLESIVESLLFISDAPLTMDKLCAILEEYEAGAVKAAVARLRRGLRRSCRGALFFPRWREATSFAAVMKMSTISGA